MEASPDEESIWLEFVGIKEAPRPTWNNSDRKLMLVEFNDKGSFESPEYFTWAPKWEDLVDIVVHALLVEHQNTSREVEQLIGASNGAGALRDYLVQKKTG
jgi:hypothetical protein